MYDSEKYMALASGIVAGLNIYISVLTNVGLDGMTVVVRDGRGKIKQDDKQYM